MAASKQIKRLFEMENLFAQYIRPVTAEEVSRWFPRVSRKTIDRDLDALKDVGVILSETKDGVEFWYHYDTAVEDMP